jgi:hypothetical protein
MADRAAGAVTFLTAAIRPDALQKFNAISGLKAMHDDLPRRLV